MSSPEIKAILTDVGGVLIKNYDTTANDVQKRVGLPDEEFLAVWNKEIAAFGSGGDEYHFWRAFADAGGKDVPADGRVFREPFEENLHIYSKVLNYMGRSGCHLAVLSNTIEPHSTVLRRQGVYDRFGEHVFLSNEIRARKPSPDAYEIALKRMKAFDPEEIVFIDDKEANLIVPRQMGMRTLLATGDEDMIVASLASFFTAEHTK